MANFQYRGQGHTFVQNVKGIAHKVKVVEGEIVNIEEGIHSDSRLAMAGFKKIMDGASDVISAAVSAIGDVAESIEKITETIQEPAETAPEDTTPAPSVEVSVEDDGKDGISVSVENTEPAKPKTAKKK